MRHNAFDNVYNVAVNACKYWLHNFRIQCDRTHLLDHSSSCTVTTSRSISFDMNGDRYDSVAVAYTPLWELRSTIANASSTTVVLTATTTTTAITATATATP
jgi:hypothetical protein